MVFFSLLPYTTIFDAIVGLTKGRILHASGGCAERPFSPICVHSCVPTAALATGRGPRVPRRRRPHGPRDARAPGPEAHAAGAVTQPPTHTSSRSLILFAHLPVLVPLDVTGCAITLPLDASEWQADRKRALRGFVWVDALAKMPTWQRRHSRRACLSDQARGASEGAPPARRGG